MQHCPTLYQLSAINVNNNFSSLSKARKGESFLEMLTPKSHVQKGGWLILKKKTKGKHVDPYGGTKMV